MLFYGKIKPSSNVNFVNDIIIIRDTMVTGVYEVTGTDGNNDGDGVTGGEVSDADAESNADSMAGYLTSHSTIGDSVVQETPAADQQEIAIDNIGETEEENKNKTQMTGPNEVRDSIKFLIQFKKIISAIT